MNANRHTAVNVPRFVVLRHQPGLGLKRNDASDADQMVEHFDWMFEIDGSLKTWTTDVVDELRDKIETEAMQLPDHRLAYLTYEGEISNDRGHVQRTFSGTFETLELSPDRLLAELTFDGRHDMQKARVDIQRNLICFDAVTRDAWALEFELCR